MALDQDIEEVRPVEAPLDILAQVVLSMTSVERWDIDDLYGFLRTSYPFRDLSRKHFDQVLEMLAGRYADSRLRELRPRVSLDRVDNTVQANPEVPYLLSTSGGTIPDRGYFDLRVSGTHAKIGELDEEFVWERSLGDTFTLGAQVWRIEKITHNDVEVSPAVSAPGIFPFWKAEEQDRDFHLSEAIGLFLEQADQKLDDPLFASELRSGHGMDNASVTELLSFLRLQKETIGTRLPHRHHLLIEEVEDPQAKGERKQIIVHTFWGNRVNRPFGLALCRAWEEREGTPIQLVTTDDALLFMLPRAAAGQDLLSLVTPENVEPLLRKKLEQTGFFGARFRENAERALLLPKASFKRRTPLWLIRLRAKELLAAISRYDDFPIVLETWRTCLRDEFDLEHLTGLLEELREGSIAVSSVRTAAASPFAGNLVWKQTNKYMYDDDTPLARPGTTAPEDLIKEVLFSPHLRPKIPQELASQLDKKLKRLAEGYAPASGRELLDWVKERLLVPEEEWQELRAAILRDVEADADAWLREENRKLLWLSWPGLGGRMLSALESLPKVLVALRLLLDDAAISPGDPSDTDANARRRSKAYLRTAPSEAAPAETFDLSQFLSAWLAYYGPIEKTRLGRLLAIPTERLDEALEPLVEAQELVVDQFLETSSSPEVCDSGNLGILLRMHRRMQRPSFEALPLSDLQLFLAQYRGIASRGSSIEDLQQRIEQLMGWPASAGAWEEHLLPARMIAYRNEWLDSLMATSDLLWFGCGEKKLSLCFSQDLELFRLRGRDDGTDGHLAQLIPDRRGKYSFLEIAQFSHLDTVHAAEELWKEAWKGHVTSDSFRVVRKGVQTGFRAPAASADERLASRRSGFNRWKASRPLEGNWLRIDSREPDRGLLEEEELAKDRLRQLFKRYGILFRELLANELPLLQWRSLFRQLRLMELSGEVLSGYFFSGLSGPQFASHEAFRMLREPLRKDRLFWMNATDPASLCGILPGLVPRIPSNDLVYQGSELVMISRRSGKALEILIPPRDRRLPDCFSLFSQFLSREFDPLQKIVVETVNNESVQKSPYIDALKAFGFRQSRNVLELWREV
jgi:ATP-dependent Lhr-like helicase